MRRDPYRLSVIRMMLANSACCLIDGRTAVAAVCSDDSNIIRYCALHSIVHMGIRSTIFRFAGSGAILAVRACRTCRDSHDKRSCYSNRRCGYCFRYLYHSYVLHKSDGYFFTVNRNGFSFAVGCCQCENCFEPVCTTFKIVLVVRHENTGGINAF